MEERGQEEQRYRGRDLMNSQKKMLFKNLMDIIKKEKGELLYLLDCKEKNTEEYHRHKKELEWTHAWENDPQKEDEIKENMTIIDRAQGDILRALQPLFREKFDQVAHETPPGIGYNEALRQYIRFDFIFGERDIPGPGEGSREHYRIEQRYRSTEESYQRRLEKIAEKRKKEKEKIWLPLDHHLIANKNYERYAKRIARHMEKTLNIYADIFHIDKKDKTICKNSIETYFLYMFIKALMDTRCVFDIKSTKGGKCLDGTIDLVLEYFKDIVGQKIEIVPKDIKRKLRSNMKDNGNLLDLSYTNALIQDIEDREQYLDQNYFMKRGTTVDQTRREIMQEYNAQKGLKEKAFEFINPRYHIYKENIDKYTKHLQIIEKYKEEKKDQDPYIMQLITDLKQKIIYAQEKKKEHTVFEEDKKITPRFDHSLTEIMNKAMKKYQVPIQYRHIFGIVMNKINNFYQMKKGIVVQAEKSNNLSFENLLCSDQSNQQIMYFIHNYHTQKHIDQHFEKERNNKRSERILQISHNIKHHNIGPNRADSAKKIAYMPDGQLTLDI